MEDFCTQLIRRAQAMEIALPQAQAEQFRRYHAMLAEANARFNLTRVESDEEAIDRNDLDSLTPLRGPWLDGAGTLIDVGSGAGFPGIPLAIARPQMHVTLLEAQKKRARFLTEVVSALSLNATVEALRAEEAARRPDLRESFDVAVARAVAPLNVLLEYLLPFVRVGGCAVALKGPTADEEVQSARHALEALGGAEFERVPAPIPGRDWRHELVIVRKSRATDAAYPRRAGIPEKRPLK